MLLNWNLTVTQKHLVDMKRPGESWQDKERWVQAGTPATLVEVNLNPNRTYRVQLEDGNCQKWYSEEAFLAHFSGFTQLLFVLDANSPEDGISAGLFAFELNPITLAQLEELELVGRRQWNIHQSSTAEVRYWLPFHGAWYKSEANDLVDEQMPGWNGPSGYDYAALPSLQTFQNLEPLDTDLERIELLCGNPHGPFPGIFSFHAFLDGTDVALTSSTFDLDNLRAALKLPTAERVRYIRRQVNESVGDNDGAWAVYKETTGPGPADVFLDQIALLATEALADKLMEALQP